MAITKLAHSQFSSYTTVGFTLQPETHEHQPNNYITLILVKILGGEWVVDFQHRLSSLSRFALPTYLFAHADLTPAVEVAVDGMSIVCVSFPNISLKRFIGGRPADEYKLSGSS